MASFTRLIVLTAAAAQVAWILFVSNQYIFYWFIKLDINTTNTMQQTCKQISILLGFKKLFWKKWDFVKSANMLI